MTRHHKKTANHALIYADDARCHSDNARRSSDEHLEQLAKMHQVAIAAAEHPTDRNARTHVTMHNSS